MDVNISIIGQTSVGKTSIALRFVNDVFNTTIPSTTGAAFLRKTVYSSNGQPQRFRIWDTAGQERFRAVAPMYYRQAAIILVVFDLSQPSSFEEVEFWVNKIKAEECVHAKLIVVGNKCDLESRVGQRGKEYSDKNQMKYFEVSAATGDGINEMFQEFANLNASGPNGALNSQLAAPVDVAQKQEAKKGCC